LNLAQPVVLCCDSFRAGVESQRISIQWL
jgi:hypothetical protein